MKINYPIAEDQDEKGIISVMIRTIYVFFLFLTSLLQFYNVDVNNQLKIKFFFSFFKFRFYNSLFNSIRYSSIDCQLYFMSDYQKVYFIFLLLTSPQSLFLFFLLIDFTNLISFSDEYYILFNSYLNLILKNS